MKIAVASLRFAPGHLAHLRAYRELFLAIDCEVKLFLDGEYRSFMEDVPDTVFITDYKPIIEWKPDRVLSYNISPQNIQLAKKCKRNKIPFFYVLHEPWDSLKELMSMSKSFIPKRIIVHGVNYLIAKNAYKVILASDFGRDKYLRYMKGCNKNYDVFPLIFCDDYDSSVEVERKYFSFIGGFTKLRGCYQFLDLIKYSISEDNGVRFLIATRSSIDSQIEDPVIKQAINDGRLSVYSGKPMTSKEINYHYRESICAWNAYITSTQSGVLANALMQGTPVIVTDRGDSADIVKDKRECRYISLPHNNQEMISAYQDIVNNLEEYVKNARQTFEQKYKYSVYVERAKKVFEIGKP